MSAYREDKRLGPVAFVYTPQGARRYTLEEAVEAMRRMGCPDRRIEAFMRHAMADVMVVRVGEVTPE